MSKDSKDSLRPEKCVSDLFDISGEKFEPTIAADIWPKIIKHKWVLSEKVGRDVGIRTACIDYLENIDTVHDVHIAYKQAEILHEMGAQSINRDIWDTISDSQPPKQLVQRRIILPLIEEGLSRKHGVVPPKAIVFFGPPGTGKTHFAKAVAGVLSWWYIEVVPSMLMSDGLEKIGANLRLVMEKAHNLNEVVIFIDEFDEIAGNRDVGDRIDKSITNEFLKQIPLLKSNGNKILLICATNYIRQLDAAMLRPGRFDCIIPVGGLDDGGRSTIIEYYISKINAGKIDLDQIVRLTSGFTPADIEYLFHMVAQFAFEQEHVSKKDYLVTTDTITKIMETIQPSLSIEVIKEFEDDSVLYSRI